MVARYGFMQESMELLLWSQLHTTRDSGFFADDCVVLEMLIETSAKFSIQLTRLQSCARELPVHKWGFRNVA